MAHEGTSALILGQLAKGKPYAVTSWGGFGPGFFWVQSDEGGAEPKSHTTDAVLVKPNILRNFTAGIDTNGTLENTGTFTTKLTVSSSDLSGAGFENGDEALVLFWALLEGDISGAGAEWRITYNGTDITNPVEPWRGITNGGVGLHVGFVGRVNLSTLDDFDFDLRRNGGTNNSFRALRARMIILDLEDMGIEDVDWFWDKSTTSATHTNAFSSTNRAAISWTPTSEDDWVAITFTQTEVNNAGNRVGIRTMFDTSTLVSGDILMDPDSGNTSSIAELTNVMFGVVESVDASSHTIVVETKDDITATQNAHRESAIFMFRASLFTNLGWDLGSDLSLSANTDTLVASVTTDAAVPQQAIVMGVGAMTQAAVAVWMWVEEDGSVMAPITDPTGDFPSVTNMTGSGGSNDKFDLYWLGNTEISGSTDYELYLRQEASGPWAIDNPRLLVWPLELAPTPPPTRTHGTDVLIQATSTKAHTADAVLQTVLEGEVVHATNALILKTSTRTHTTDAVVVRAVVHTTDACLSGTVTKTHTTDAVRFQPMQMGDLVEVIDEPGAIGGVMSDLAFDFDTNTFLIVDAGTMRWYEVDYDSNTLFVSPALADDGTWGLAYDGTVVWVSNVFDDNLRSYNRTTGALLTDASISPSSLQAMNLEYDPRDGTFWVGAFNTTPNAYGIYKMTTSGAATFLFDPPNIEDNARSQGMAWVDPYLWILSGRNNVNSIYQVNDEGDVQASFTIDDQILPAVFVKGLAYDGTLLWTTDPDGNRLLGFFPGAGEITLVATISFSINMTAAVVRNSPQPIRNQGPPGSGATGNGAGQGAGAGSGGGTGGGGAGTGTGTGVSGDGSRQGLIGHYTLKNYRKPTRIVRR